MEDETIDAILDYLKKQDFTGGLVLLSEYLEKKPGNLKLLNLRANVYSRLNQHERAVDDLINAIKIAPSLLELHYNLGNEYSKLGNHYAAIRSFRKALEINPTNLSVLFNIGNALMKNGQYGEAVTKYKDVLEIEPDHGDCITNLLICYFKANDYEAFLEESMKILGTSKCSLEICKKIMSLSLKFESEDIFQEALSHIAENWGLDFDVKILVARYKARFASVGEAVHYLNGETWTVDEAHKVYYTVSTLYSTNHEHTKAFIFLEKALNLSPENADYLKLYATLLENRVVPGDSVNRTALLCNILDLNLTRPELIAAELSSSTHKSLTKLMPLEGQSLGWDETRKIIQAIFEFGVLTRVLQKSQFVTCDMEDLLSRLSTLFVEHKIEMYSDKDALLLWQYFIIYNHRSGFLIQGDYAPVQSAKKVNFDIDEYDNMNEQDIVALHAEILVGATYSMLTQEMSAVLMRSNNNCLKPIQAFIRETAKITKHKKIIEESNRAYFDQSVAMADQFRNHPYPTWHTLILKRKRSVSDYLDGFPIIYDRNTTVTAEIPRVLIAGCGTGRKALEFGNSVPSAYVDAIDVNSQNLAFAKLRQEENQIRNVKFSFGDINMLDGNKTKYNIIECSGLLHRSDNQERALSHLVSVLEPGGLILLGLYSSYARKEIIGIRDKFSNKEGAEMTVASVRAERKKLFSSDGFTRSWMNFSPDFYSADGFRDLFFNVQDHTYTLTQVSSLLKKNKLNFCGLVTSAFQLGLDAQEIVNHRPNDINYWAEYEKRKSTTFGRIYQFWCQKLIS